MKINILIIIVITFIITLGSIASALHNYNVDKQKEVCVNNGMVFIEGSEDFKFTTCIDQNGNKKYFNKEEL